MSQRKNETHEQFLERLRAERKAQYAVDLEFRERIAAYGRRKRAEPEYRERYLRRGRERAAALHADPVWRKQDSLRRRAKTFGLSRDVLAEMQEAGCGICGIKATGRNLHVDHDHACCSGTRQSQSCGACVRGALCYLCNLSFERYLDSPRVIAYLERTPAGRATLLRAT